MSITVIVCGSSRGDCICKCPDSCGHTFDADKPIIEDGRIRGASLVCSRCGMSAMEHDVWVLP